MELSGRDEAMHAEDASADVEMMAHEAMDQEMRDEEMKECGSQESEPVKVMRNRQGFHVETTRAPQGHVARGVC